MANDNGSAPSAIQPFNPSTVTEAMDMAKMLSTSDIIPTPLKKKPGDIFVILAHGRELGIAPMTALSELYVVEGKPSSSAKLKMGLCLNRPSICEYFRLVESTKTKATYETKRVGHEPVRMTWTIEQAAAAGLTNKSNWKNYPDAMLRARCSSALADAVYPDLVKGLVTEDEAEDIRPEKEINAAPTPAGGTTEAVKARLAERLNGGERKLNIVDVPPAAETAAPAVAGGAPAAQPSQEVSPPLSLRERFDALWERAKAVTTRPAFAQWAADKLQSDKPKSKGWPDRLTADEIAYLETAFDQTIGKPDAQESF